MRVIALAIATFAFVLHAAPAYAGIETLIGSAVFASLISAGVTTYAATVITTIFEALLLPAVAVGASLALAPKLPSVPDPGDAKETFTAADGAELRALGRVRLGGLIAFGNSYSNRRYRLYCHCKGEIDGFEALYLGGREVIIDGSGNVQSLPWRIDSTSYAVLDLKNGTATETSYLALRQDFTGMWTTDHRLRGIAQTLCKFINPGLDDPLFLELYQGGVPKLEAQLRGEKLYDPRTETTAWSDNGVLAVMHVLRSLYTVFALADFDTAQISTAATAADALIPTKAGNNVAASRCWGVFTSETPRGDTMQALLDSVGVEIVPRDGGSKLGLQLIKDNPTSELTIKAKHIVGLTWRDGPEGVQRPNRCTLTYYSPERNYDKGEIDLSGVAWAKYQDEIDAYGEQKLDIVLPFCPHASQAQRRARQIFALARAPSGVVRTNMAGRAAVGCRYVTFELPDNLGTMLTRIDAPRALRDEGIVEIPFRVWPTLSPWSVDDDEAAAPDQLPDPTLGQALTRPTAPTEPAVVVTYPDASIHTRIGYTIPADADVVEAAYRQRNGGVTPTLWAPMNEQLAARDAVGAPLTAIEPVPFAFVPGTLAGAEHQFRLRTTNGFNGSDWSNIRTTTPVAVNTAPGSPELTLVASGDDVDIWVTAPADLHVAYLELTGEEVSHAAMATSPAKQFKAGTFTKPDPLPGTPQTFTWTARAFSSNGTGGPTATKSVTIPAA